MEYLNAFWTLLNEMSPYLLLGFLIAGVLHVYVPHKLYNKYLSSNSFSSVFWAAMFGIPLPLCSCGVIPTAMSLRKDGASKGATTSFLIATPQTGVDSIMATFSLLGLPFAIIRPIVALITAIGGGIAVNKLSNNDEITENNEIADECDCCGVDHNKNKLFRVFRYGYIEMLQDIGKWLIIGLILAALITIFVPTSFFEQYANTPIKNMLLVLVFSVPMYLCATGSIPIAAALMLKGMSPGAALVLLMAGPATNMASILVIKKVMGMRSMIVYLASIIVGAVGFGLIIDYILPPAWFSSTLASTAQACCMTDVEGPNGIPIFKTTCSIVLVCLLIYAFTIKHTKHQIQNKMIAKYKVNGMHCNHCKESVEKSIAKIDGVTSVNVDLTQAIAYVDGNVGEQKIREAIEALGFEYGGIIK